MKLSKFLISACLMTSLITPIFAMDGDDTGAVSLQSLLSGVGAQQESILSLLQTTVSAGGEYPKLSDMIPVFDDDIKYTANVLGDNFIITGELSYSPSEPLKDFTMSLTQAEKKGGVFTVFADQLKRNLLKDHKELLPETLTKQSTKAEDNYAFAELLFKTSKEDKSSLLADLREAKKKKDAVEDLEEQAEELLKTKLANGIAEFKQVYSVPANPQLIFNAQNLLVKVGKKARNTSLASLLSAAQKNQLLGHGTLTLSLKSEMMTEEQPVEMMMEEQSMQVITIENTGEINKEAPISVVVGSKTATPASTLRFDSSSMDLDDVVTLIEGAIVAQMEETISLVENAFLQDKAYTGMHS